MNSEGKKTHKNSLHYFSIYVKYIGLFTKQLYYFFFSFSHNYNTFLMKGSKISTVNCMMSADL